MRAVRLGSYSMCATLAGTPSLSWRRKSINRYARLWPPPWCRVVMRPALLRPPLLCRGRTSDFSGSSRMTSTKSAWLAPRRPGVVGLYLRIAMSARTNLAEYVDPVAFAKRDDRALDRLARAVAESGPLPFAWPVERVHVGDLDIEHLLDGDLDLRLVRQRVDVERVLVLVQQAVALLRDDRSEQHIAGIVEHKLCSSSDVSSAAFLAAAFLAAVFFAGAFSAVAFSAVAFSAVAFSAIAFSAIAFAGAFLAGAFLAGAFSAVAFSAAAFLAGAFLAGAFSAAASSTGSAAGSSATSATSASTSPAASSAALVAATFADLPVAGLPRKDSSADCVNTTSSLISTSYVFS